MSVRYKQNEESALRADIDQIKAAEKNTAALLSTTFRAQVASDWASGANVIDDKTILDTAELVDWPEWAAGTAYPAGMVIKHGETLYRVQQAVTAQAHQQPGGAGMLAVYAPVQMQSEEDQEAGKILLWVNGEPGLAVGDKREYKGAVYEAIQSPGANIWTPDAVPAIWKKVA